MAVSLTEIKAKIASTRKISQITAAMQMISATKFQKSENLAKNYQIYADRVHQITTDLISHNNGSTTNPLLINREVKKTGYLVITSDRGLVGGYNSDILKAVLAKLKENPSYSILAMGGMGVNFFNTHEIEIAYELRDISEQLSFEEVREIVNQAVKLYQNEVFDELYICYNHHVNSQISQVRMEKILPIFVDTLTEDRKSSAIFELDPGREAILEQLLPQYAESMIYRAIVDAKTAEHAAGMMAMRTATNNAHTVINNLTLQYNRARQAEITQEIIEIMAGVSTLQ